MKRLLGATLLASLFCVAHAAAQAQSAPKCKVAEINPVTNHAHCIDPVGGVLPPDAPKPCQNVHQTGNWAMSNTCDTAPATKAN
ncbi:MAG TPA: hypothetical protein VKV77_04055 [Methylovirgula sp.]|nr:hypothetical protein [Methylovirgula sp.]